MTQSTASTLPTTPITPAHSCTARRFAAPSKISVGSPGSHAVTRAVGAFEVLQGTVAGRRRRCSRPPPRHRLPNCPDRRSLPASRTVDHARHRPLHRDRRRRAPAWTRLLRQLPPAVDPVGPPPLLTTPHAVELATRAGSARVRYRQRRRRRVGPR
jgi:hypothetical protein